MESHERVKPVADRIPPAWKDMLKPFLATYSLEQLVRASNRSIDADVYFNKPGGSFLVTIPADFQPSKDDFRHLPDQLDVKGSMTVPAEALSFLYGKAIDVSQDLIVTYADVPPSIDEVGAIPGLSFGDVHFVQVRDRVPSPERSKEEQISRMSREQFVRYLMSHREQYARLVDERILDDDTTWKEIYERITLKPRYRALRGIKMMPKDIEGHRAVREYEKRMREMKEWVFEGRSFVRGGQKSLAWASWTFEGHVSSESTKKAYITLENAVDDLTPELVERLLGLLENIEYHGNMKVPTQAKRARLKFDNIVLHGDEEVILHATSIISQALREAGVRIENVEFAKDPHGESHSSALAKEVAKAWGLPVV